MLVLSATAPHSVNHSTPSTHIFSDRNWAPAWSGATAIPAESAAEQTLRRADERMRTALIERAIRNLATTGIGGSEESGGLADWNYDPCYLAVATDPQVQLAILDRVPTESSSSSTRDLLIYCFPVPYCQVVSDRLAELYRNGSPEVREIAFAVMCTGPNPQFINQYLVNLSSQDIDSRLWAEFALSGLLSNSERVVDPVSSSNCSQLDSLRGELGVRFDDRYDLIERLTRIAMEERGDNQLAALRILGSSGIPLAVQVVANVLADPCTDAWTMATCLSLISDMPPKSWPKLSADCVANFIAQGHDRLILELGRALNESPSSGTSVIAGLSREELTEIASRPMVQIGLLDYLKSTTGGRNDAVAAILSLNNDPSIQGMLARHLEGNEFLRMKLTESLVEQTITSADLHHLLDAMATGKETSGARLHLTRFLHWHFRNVDDPEILARLVKGYENSTGPGGAQLFAVCLAATGTPQGLALARGHMCDPLNYGIMSTLCLEEYLKHIEDPNLAAELTLDVLTAQSRPIGEKFPERAISSDGLELVWVSSGCYGPTPTTWARVYINKFAPSAIYKAMARRLCRPLSPQGTVERGREVAALEVCLETLAQSPTPDGVTAARSLIDQHISGDTYHSAVLVDRSLGLLVAAFEKDVCRDEIRGYFAAWLASEPTTYPIREWATQAVIRTGDRYLGRMLLVSGGTAPDLNAAGDELVAQICCRDMPTIQRVLDRVSELKSGSANSEETRALRYKLVNMLQVYLRPDSMPTEPAITSALLELYLEFGDTASFINPPSSLLPELLRASAGNGTIVPFCERLIERVSDPAINMNFDPDGLIRTPEANVFLAQVLRDIERALLPY